MKNNKKGSLAFTFIYAIGFLMALGLLYVLFNQVIQVEFQPVIENTIADDSPVKDKVLQMNSEWLSYWEFIPVLLVFAVMLYLFNAGVMQGGQQK